MNSVWSFWKLMGLNTTDWYVKRNDMRSRQFLVHKRGNLNGRENFHHVSLSERNPVDGYSATFSGGYRPDELFEYFRICSLYSSYCRYCSGNSCYTRNSLWKREHLCLTSNRILDIQYIRNHQCIGNAIIEAQQNEKASLAMTITSALTAISIVCQNQAEGGRPGITNIYSMVLDDPGERKTTMDKMLMK